MKTAKAVIGVLLVAVAGVATAHTLTSSDNTVVTTPAPTPVPADIAALLGKVQIVDARGNSAGYDRDCGPKHGCVFGHAWTDDHAGPGGHDGCDTRDDVLAGQLTEVTFRPRTHDCVVLTGKLADPYTGTQIPFRKTSPMEIQIDHVYSLALAWRMGADKWTPQRRIDFANDQVLNLLAVSGKANHDKSDKSPAQWIVPDNPAFQCDYLRRYLAVAAQYELPITTADASAIRRVAAGCPAH